MKTKHWMAMSLACMLFVPGGVHTVTAQNGDGYFTVSGIVKDARSKKEVEYVNVSAVGTNIGTVTNEDGVFQLKLSNATVAKEIELSCIGYYNARIAITGRDMKEQTYLIIPESFHLSEIEIFSWKNPRDLIRAALDKLPDNYPVQPNMLTGFYRETIQKRRKYINISEAVIQVYKSPYTTNASSDRVRILKGRKLVSPKVSDTLHVKLLGGPNMAAYVDIVKNPDILLDAEMLQYFSYRMGETTSINGQLQFVVHFEPQAALPYPLYSGTFYIDRETLSFTRAEFSMDMKDKLKVIDLILKEKPAGLRFTPEEVSYIVTYKQRDGKTALNYICNKIRFKCDWKRRLFATSYTVVSETVITDSRAENVEKIPAREAFSMRQSLSQEVSAYFDDDFWGAYNIIEPTESLENAVNRLMKQQSKSK
ncbi:MAG: carboxypeptidase-like regulatory domain-containing protein [Tannerella sp.]|nr:carboxypeptidase-like regulatory domain-containing protein [Tannerella sp.]